MVQQFEILMDPKQVATAVIELNQIEGIQVQLPIANVSWYEEGEHPSYNMSFAELAPVIVSITGMVTGFLALAKAILELKSEKQKNEKEVGKNSRPQIAIQINQQIVLIEEFATPQDLALYLEEKLR